jgi:tetratricopeptide (TPR) repeat protein
LRESLEIRIGALGREHPAVAGSMTLLANCLVGNGEYEEALSLAREAQAAYTAALSADHWRTAVAVGAEGAALAGQRNFAAAEPLLLQSHSVLTQDPNAMSVFVTEASRRLESLYSEWGRPNDAAKFRRRADD